MSDRCRREGPGGGRGGVRHDERQYFEVGRTPDNHLVEVFLDGVRIPDATIAHAGQGWVTFRVRGADGEYVRDGMGCIKYETKHGKVELRRCND